MGIIDIIILSILALGFISGIQKGFLTSVFACAAMVFAWLIALSLLDRVSVSLQGTNLYSYLTSTVTAEALDWNTILDAAGFLILFLIAFAALLLIVNLINNVFRVPKIRVFDGLLGGILGVVRAMVIVLVLFSALQVCLKPIPEAETMFAAMLDDSLLGGIVKGLDVLRSIY